MVLAARSFRTRIQKTLSVLAQDKSNLLFQKVVVTLLFSLGTYPISAEKDVAVVCFFVVVAIFSGCFLYTR